MITCKQCSNELICKYRDTFEEVQNQVTKLVEDAGKDIFYGNVECRYRSGKSTMKKDIVLGGDSTTIYAEGQGYEVRW